jgi:ABC-type lipoprotein release transport system permease subunit
VAIAGTVTGIAASLAADRLWRSIVFGSDSPDPLLVTALALMFGLLALLASVVPATRAARIDPSEALRAE